MSQVHQRKIFAIGRGQYENIGDIMLRRPLLDWLRPLGELNVYVGASPDGYDEGLGLRPGDRVFRSLKSWYASALRAALRGDGVYVFKPGEIQLTLIGMKEHLSMLPLLLALRLCDGRAIRVGVGTRNYRKLPRALLTPSILLSDYTRWRDPSTAEFLGHGKAMPDLAFGEGAPDELVGHFAESRERDVLVVSMRADDDGTPRPYPSGEWIAGVREFAKRAGLEIWAVTQVQGDDDRAYHLARDLDAKVLGWPAVGDHADQERRLRELYRRSAMALSDRLHVLIAAFSEGAVPVGSLTNASDKIDRHFRAIGIEDVSVATGRVNEAGAPSAAEVAAQLTAMNARRPELFEKLAAARADLRGVRADIAQIAQGERRRREAPDSTRPTVHHLGRAGDIAGGMTQVLNGYLGWSFANVDVNVITSRADPHDHLGAARHFSQAAAKIRRLDPTNSVVVAHVSERGSFVREGLLLQLAKARGIPTIAHLHGSEFAKFAQARPRLVGATLRAADRIISLSAESSEVAARFVEADRIALVPNAVPGGESREKRNLVVFGGVVSRRKGVDVLVDAWEALGDATAGWELMLAGPVREPGVVRKVARMKVLGSLPHAELMRLLETSRIAVLPSRDEAMPMFILEAMARRNCVISTAVGGIAAVLADDVGIVLAPGDASGLTDALRAVLCDPARLGAYADAAHAAYAETYAAEAIFPRLEEMWLGVR